ncbi:carbohydrate-binding protein [Pseudobacteroides cellulosolvens]|uniref:Carbohydrate binding family 25 n=1 Tax=Pseudobacteroides cellulosolvens ATCC 35603 = DSM 2933 TaxID=398512 RepID=A0A0L6JIT3_9FIRM|nr:carbohydrate-binding protein [Pseudobacteroides cellulosolvens]KNY25751.1 Carbohydrate binding family 25 [Pseudobacteroides cellulosolvens ATCC 35603 = DSM 2933]
MARASKNNEYLQNGLTISPAVPTAGEKVKVQYDGLLSKSGASDLYVHIGYGSNWQKSSFFKMNKSLTGFEASLPVEYGDTMNLCFKDSADNWDNNSGRNYSFDVSQ